jgi:TolB-like protein
MIYRFDDFELDTDSFELRRGGEVQAVEPKILDLISLLCANSGRVVSRDELMEAIWDGRIVAEATISTSIKFARKALGDSGEEQKYIRTVRGRGFRFGAEVEIVEPGNDGQAASALDDGRVRSSDVTLALLPLTVLSEDVELEFFADGLVEDLTTILARMSMLTVISRSSAFQYKGAQPSPEQVREELGASHIVMGSVRPLGDIARINVQLVEAEHDKNLWADRFDRPIAQLFELQDEIIRAVSRLLEPRLARETYELLEPQRYENDSWDAYRRADSLLATRGWHGETFGEAASLLRRSVELDPTSARAQAFLSLILGFGQRVGLAHDRETAKAESLLAADIALSLDDTDPSVLGNAGCALADIGKLDRGLRLLERAIELDPSNAQAWAALGAAKVVAGLPAEGAEDLRQGIRISPLDNRLSVWGSILALALFLQSDVDGALAEAEAAARRDPRNYMPHVVKGAILVAVDRVGDAREAIGEAVRLRPVLSRAEFLCLVGPDLLLQVDNAGLLEGVRPEVEPSAL